MTNNIRFEMADPILSVADMLRSVQYYVDVLGFRNADWGNEHFTAVTRDTAGIYLCQGGQGQKGTWAWVGVSDVGALHEEYRARGADIRLPPTNYPWAYEMQVRDPDEHILRFGSDPLEDQPFVNWVEVEP